MWTKTPPTDESSFPPGTIAPVDRLRVLLVEDNDDVRWALQAVCEAEGHEVMVAGNGRTGLDAALEMRPDIAILDIGLPVMNGYELATALRARFGRDELMLVALTGYGSKEHREQGMRAGFDLYLVKPMNIDVMRDVLLRAEGRKRMRAQSSPGQADASAR